MLFVPAGPLPAAGLGQTAVLPPVPIPGVPRWPMLLALGAWALVAAISLAQAARARRALGRVRRSVTPFPSSREARLRALEQSARNRPVRATGPLGPGRRGGSPRPGLTRYCCIAGSRRRCSATASSTKSSSTSGRTCSGATISRGLRKSLIRGLVWMHPAVRWIDRQLDLEREVACDDWAVNIAGGARDFAGCLARWPRTRGNCRRATLVPAAVATTSLTVRVRRLLQAGRNTAT